MSNRPDWDNQFAETEDERNARLAALRRRRLVYDKTQRTIVDVADSTRTGMFVLHNCWKCSDGKAPCVAGNPRQCDYPHARND